MFVEVARIHYDNEIEVQQLDEDRISVRQRHLDTDEWSAPLILQADELRELVELAKFLGWEL